MDEAEEATRLRATMLMKLPGAPEVFPRLAPSGLASATVVQEALEGGGALNIKAIYFNATGVELLGRHPPGVAPARAAAFPEGTFQTAAELRNVVAALGSGTHHVDIYIRHGGGLSIIRAGSQVVEGAALPAEFRPHLPPTFRTLPPSAAPGGAPGQGPAPGKTAPAGPSATAGGGRATRTTRPMKPVRAPAKTPTGGGGATPEAGARPPATATGAGAAAAEAAAPRGAVARPGVRFAGLTGFVVTLGVQMIVLYVITRVLDERERRRVKELFQREVAPAAESRIKSLSNQAVALVEQDPFRPVYATVTVTVVTRGSKYHGKPLGEAVRSASVANVALARRSVEQELLLTDRDFSSPFTTTTPFERTYRTVYAVPIEFDSTPARLIAWSVRRAVSRRLPVRLAVSSSWTAGQREAFAKAYVDATRGRRELLVLHEDAARFQAEIAEATRLEAQFGRATVASVRAATRSGLSARAVVGRTHWSSRAERERYVQAYVEVTRNKALMRPLHEDAIRFLQELKQAPVPEEERLREWVKERQRREQGQPSPHHARP